MTSPTRHRLPHAHQTKRRRGPVIAGMAVLAIILAPALIIASGVYHVGVTAPHSRPTEWILRTTMENSVRAHARDIRVPIGTDLHDPALAEQAIGHYSAACRSCHGAPGAKADPWMVIYPPAPDLIQSANRWSDAELYWIIKHGIKGTGMLALGPTHQEKDLWAVTAFVRQLPEMSPERYAAMVRRYERRRPAGGGMAAPGNATAPMASPSHEH